MLLSTTLTYRSRLLLNFRCVSSYSDLNKYLRIVLNTYSNDSKPLETNHIKFSVPKRIQEKVISASEACELISSGDTICCSGFVSQGSPEAVLKALGERFEETGKPSRLTLLFGGGPGDWKDKGLNHLAKVKVDENTGEEKKMLLRTIGGHYGQTPLIAKLALSNEVEAWTLPLGSISRMIRAQSTHSPGHLTTIGIGTYIDPNGNGGAINELAKQSPLHSELITRIQINNEDHLMYKALPINVAIIRGTTADGHGNISLEHESLRCDQREIATAAKNSGGLVIAQVKRLAALGSIPTNDVAIPGPLVDCVVVVDEEDHDTLHPMSYFSRHDANLTCEVKSPADELPKLILTQRKVIARRAAFALKPDKVVNLGIGLPEGVASVAAEEGMLEYITLSTEAGIFGGLPASGVNFGPGSNADARIEMNQMFDFYNGGGLDMCFLGAGQVSPQGDVNVSRLSKDKLTGPGGFIDISQSTRSICFMLAFTAKGLETEIKDGKLNIIKEGSVKKFVPQIIETTFSGTEAIRRGQKVFYVTERAVFRLSAENDTIELIEIAPGVDLQKDILDQMEFKPIISPTLKTMDKRIFEEQIMNLSTDMFGSFDDRCIYHEEDHALYIDLFGVTLSNENDIDRFYIALSRIMEPLVEEKGPLNVIVNYDGFDLRSKLAGEYSKRVGELQEKYYKTVMRYAGPAFRKAKLRTMIDVSSLDLNNLFDRLDTNNSGNLTIEEVRQGVRKTFGLNLTPSDLATFKTDDEGFIPRDSFVSAATSYLKLSGTINGDD